MRDESSLHWRRTYSRRRVEELSWTEAVPEASLALIEEAALPLDAAILDLGGGASRLAAELLGRGYRDVNVADLAAEALERAKADLGGAADQVAWIEADVRRHDFGRRFDLWHDRGLFHFMVEPADRAGYRAVLERTLKHGGHLVLASFGPEGPSECSGLPVVRYGAEAIGQELGEEYALLSSRLVDHRRPSGGVQQFTYAHLRREPHPRDLNAGQ